MRIPDIFKLNDWKIRKFNLTILSVLIAYNTIFLTNKLLFEIPILPELFGFVFITLIPGFILLRILRIHDIDRTIDFLLCIGLSLSFAMIFGLFINLILPYIGVSKPISSFPLFLSFNFAILSLLILCQLRDKDFRASQDFINIDISPLLLALFLLPFLSIFGAYVMTLFGSNIPILFLLLLVSLIPVLIAFNKIPETVYPLLIFIVSISILYQVNLISSYLWSYDVFFEAYSTNLVLKTGIWNPNLEVSSHFLFDITIPIYSLLSNLDFIWVLKIIFPFLFALTPLTLYYVYKGLDLGDYKFDTKQALFAVFVFVFFYGFFKDMPDKQHLSELFLALILMVITTTSISIQKRVPLAILFSFSLVASHYGVSYIFMLSLIFAIFLIPLMRKKKLTLLTPNFVLIFLVLAIGWYMYIASGTIFENVVRIGDHIARATRYVLTNILEILQPRERTGVAYLFYLTGSTAWLIYKLIQITLQFFIALGVIKLSFLLFKRKITNLEIPFLIIAFYIFLLTQITFFYGLGFDRVLQITLLLLSPLALVGCIVILETFKKFVNLDETTFNLFSKKIFAVFLMGFLLFNSGFVFEVSNDIVPPYAINLNRGTWESWKVFRQVEVNGALWLKNHSPNYEVSSLPMKLSKDEMILSIYYLHTKNFVYLSDDTTFLPSGICIYFGTLVSESGKIPYLAEGKIRYLELNETIFYHEVLNKSNKIFDAGGALVYYVP